MGIMVTTETETVRLGDLPKGHMFIFDNTIGMKSEYRTNAGAPECYIVGSGEMFWGGTTKAAELNELQVVPLLIQLGGR